jgi:hypothetical protein
MRVLPKGFVMLALAIASMALIGCMPTQPIQVRAELVSPFPPPPVLEPLPPETATPAPPEPVCVPEPAQADVLIPKQEPGSELIKVPVVVSAEGNRMIPKGETIVITNIDGECAGEVKDALMKRLVDNPDYNVVTRDHLTQILIETENAYSGEFNSETAARLGELLGASLFIVGRVVHCGTAVVESSDGEKKNQTSILAVLQILDLDTGKVIVSNSSQGKYIPSNTPLLIPADDSFVVNSEGPGEAGEGKGEGEGRQHDKDWLTVTSVVDPRVKAAEDLANGFADKFFSRPTWEDVELWHSQKWGYSRAIRFVKLGHCREAAEILAEVGSSQLNLMTDAAVAEYLHNYGVVLLCANEPERAMQKLRSAYRITYHEVTQRMLGLAGKVIEWSLSVEVDKEPEIDLLLERSPGKLLR